MSAREGASAREGVQITVRVEPRLVRRADAMIHPTSTLIGRPAKRADVLREALLLGLAELERNFPLAVDHLLELREVIIVDGSKDD